MPTQFVKASKNYHVRTSARLRPFIITIDGPAGVGKSTAAKLLAQRLGLVYLDTGATYRALGYAALKQGIALQDVRRLTQLANHLPLRLTQTPAGHLHVWLGAEEISRQIRSEWMTEAAAIVAQYALVRRALVRLQRRLGRTQALVAEGRDTGSVVFPSAPYKFFLTARADVRARRRQKELQGLQGRSPALRSLMRQLRQRDQLDRRRTQGPLVRPQGAVLVNTTRLTAAQVVEQILCHLPSSHDRSDA